MELTPALCPSLLLCIYSWVRCMLEPKGKHNYFQRGLEQEQETAAWIDLPYHLPQCIWLEGNRQPGFSHSHRMAHSSLLLCGSVLATLYPCHIDSPEGQSSLASRTDNSAGSQEQLDFPSGKTRQSIYAKKILGVPGHIYILYIYKLNVLQFVHQGRHKVTTAKLGKKKMNPNPSKSSGSSMRPP